MLQCRRCPPLRLLLPLRTAAATPSPPPRVLPRESKPAHDAPPLSPPTFLGPLRTSLHHPVSELRPQEGVSPMRMERGISGGHSRLNHGTRMFQSYTLKPLMVSARFFSSGPRDDDDDVEARLMRDDDGGQGFMNGPSYRVNDINFDDYQEESTFDQNSEEMLKGPLDSMRARDGEGDMSDEESGDDLNEPSDEEFEGIEQTDEELDELLANTPLFDPPEFEEPGAPEREFSFRPEGPVYYPGMEYDPEELDITKPLPPRRREPREKEAFSVQDVIDKADFRNVRFLTKFITETGTIIARKEFKMRTKSHNRITRAIKTARFFGLIPYTNMGRPKYVFNEPFDEMSGFYETDEEESRVGGNEGYDGRFRGNNNRDGRFIRRFPQRPPGFSGPGYGRR